MSHVNLVVDVNNLVWKIRHQNKLNKSKHEAYVPQLIFIQFLEELNKFYKKYKADGVLCAFEGKGNWRKKLYSDYKNKELDDIYYEDVQEAISMLFDFITTHTSIKAVSVPQSEADDVVAVACQEKDVEVENVIVSSDKDFIQLLTEPNVRLYSPQQDEERTSENPEFDLFMKIVRGDPSDNIYSAYPRVRKTKLEEAFFGDSTSFLNLMEHVNKDESKVGDRYLENKKLIDLKEQPIDIRNDISHELHNGPVGKFHQGQVMKYAKHNEVKKLVEPMLSGQFVSLFNSNFKLH